MAAIALGIAGCGDGGGDSSSSSESQVGSGDTSLDVVGYSTAAPAYESLESAFNKTTAGAQVEFNNSFGPSLDQTTAIADGQEASIIPLSTAGEMEKLASEGAVPKDWSKQPHDGIAQESIVVMSVRKGNPKGIHAFKDLLTKDVEIVVPNPATSGEARWDLLGVWAGFIAEELSPNLKPQNIKKVLEKVVVQPSSALEASEAFEDGEGDVLISNESEALQAEKADGGVEMVIPPNTLLVELPIAVADGSPTEAKNFNEFIWSEAGQKLLIAAGYRPVDPKLADPKQFPVPKGLIDMEFFGGWPGVDEYLFDEGGVIAKMEKELGVPTSG